MIPAFKEVLIPLWYVHSVDWGPNTFSLRDAYAKLVCWCIPEFSRQSNLVPNQLQLPAMPGYYLMDRLFNHNKETSGQFYGLLFTIVPKLPTSLADRMPEDE